jgi:hypothetical protein
MAANAESAENAENAEAPSPALPPTAGPLRHAVLIVADAQPVVAAYAALGLIVIARQPVPQAEARAWGQPALAGLPRADLGWPGARAPLLRVIERAGAKPRPTRFSHGWMALEILVRDVDALATRLPVAGFEVVGPPADLDVSPAIRAMQIVGPAGEMLYLTQVKAAVPPFEIPLALELPAAQMWGPLFIAVMSVPSRAAVLEACAPLQPRAHLTFETKVTVLNRALGRALDHRWPVATVQWAGRCLFEVDEVVDPAVRTPAGDELPDGLAWIAMDLPAGSRDQGGAAPHRLFALAPGVWVEPIV